MIGFLKIFGYKDLAVAVGWYDYVPYKCSGTGC